jgi:hypothetical protein
VSIVTTGEILPQRLLGPPKIAQQQASASGIAQIPIPDQQLLPIRGLASGPPTALFWSIL